MAELLQPPALVYDVVIAGGGPAGLSAALMLGRCRRKVVLCDTGTPRNASSRALHGYLTRDGTPPLELLRLGREELHRYDIATRDTAVVDVTPGQQQFDVSLEGGEHVDTRAVLFATGVRDTVPAIPGFRECYGISVHHCPYCDGWEARERRLLVTGRGRGAAGLALSLKTWSAHVTIASNGASRTPPVLRTQLAREGIAIIETTIDRLEHDNGRARHLVFSNGESHACEAVFFSAPQAPQSDLPARLGCELTRKGVVKTDHLGQTCVPGVYVVGDASRDVQFAIVAAAEGAKAAVAINKALQAQSGLAVDAPSEQTWPTAHQP